MCCTPHDQLVFHMKQKIEHVFPIMAHFDRDAFWAASVYSAIGSFMNFLRREGFIQGGMTRVSLVNRES
jgi:hypothetical protein